MMTEHTDMKADTQQRVLEPAFTLPEIYCVVVHHRTNRCFALDRRYTMVVALAEPRMGVLAKAVEVDAGWTPTLSYQRPLWIEGVPADEFTAYWLY